MSVAGVRFAPPCSYSARVGQLAMFVVLEL
jgi:hypothetical protein